MTPQQKVQTLCVRDPNVPLQMVQVHCVVNRGTSQQKIPMLCVNPTNAVSSAIAKNFWHPNEGVLSPLQKVGLLSVKNPKGLQIVKKSQSMRKRPKKNFQCQL